jgi:hypothetical protein
MLALFTRDVGTVVVGMSALVGLVVGVALLTMTGPTAPVAAPAS